MATTTASDVDNTDVFDVSATSSLAANPVAQLQDLDLDGIVTFMSNGGFRIGDKAKATEKVSSSPVGLILKMR